MMSVAHVSGGEPDAARWPAPYLHAPAVADLPPARGGQ